MSETIEIQNSAGDEWVVAVKGAKTTHHRIRLTQAELARLGQGRSAAELLEESFRFLLEREANSSIMASFDLQHISRYFPEYDSEIRERLSRRG